MKSMPTRYIKAYVVAADWELHWLRKEIRREFVVYHQSSYVAPKDLKILFDANLRDSLLYLFLVAQLGHDIACCGMLAMESLIENFQEDCRSLPQEMLWELLKAASKKGDSSG